MHRNPTKDLENKLLMQQYQVQQQQIAAENAFNTARQDAEAKARAAVAAQQAGNLQAQQDAARKAVPLGTILTSSRGLLGNPLLSATKLGG